MLDRTWTFQCRMQIVVCPFLCPTQWLPSPESATLAALAPASEHPVQEPDTIFDDLLNTLVVRSVQPPLHHSGLRDLAINFDDGDTCITADQAQEIGYLLATMLAPPSLAHTSLASTTPQLLAPPYNSVTSLVYQRAQQLQEKLQELLPTTLVRVSTLSQETNSVFAAFRIVIGPLLPSNDTLTPSATSTSDLALPTAYPLLMQSPMLANNTVALATHTAQQVLPTAGTAAMSPENDQLRSSQTPTNILPIPDRKDTATLRGNVSAHISNYPFAEVIQPLSTDRLLSGGTLQLPTDGSERLRSVLYATITTLHQTNGTSARIVLYPESLGTIVVNLHLHSATATVQIIVSSSQTLGLVEQTIETLRTDLRQSGIPTEAIAVRLQQEHSTEQQMPSLHTPTAIVAPVGSEDNPERRQKRRQHMYRQRNHNPHGHFEHFM